MSAPVLVPKKPVKMTCSVCAVHTSTAWLVCRESYAKAIAARAIRGTTKEGHVFCLDCLENAVITWAESINSIDHAELHLHGYVPCPFPKCDAGLDGMRTGFPAELLAHIMPLCDQEVWDMYSKAVKRTSQRKEMERGEVLTKDRSEREIYIEEELMVLHCPHCNQAFYDHDACPNVTCSRCSKKFCSICLSAPCKGNSARAHTVNGDFHTRHNVARREKVLEFINQQPDRANLMERVRHLLPAGYGGVEEAEAEAELPEEYRLEGMPPRAHSAFVSLRSTPAPSTLFQTEDDDSSTDGASTDDSYRRTNDDERMTLASISSSMEANVHSTSAPPPEPGQQAKVPTAQRGIHPQEPLAPAKTGTSASASRAASQSQPVPVGFVWDAQSGYHWSRSEHLYYDHPSGQFYDPDTGMWYDPEAQQWYVDE